MSRHIFIILTLLVFNSGFSQLNDNFSDGELSSNPKWEGEIVDFIINENGQLQLNAASAGSSFIFSRVTFPDSIEWRFFFRLDFAPSSSNRLRIYLMSDSEDLSSNNSYFLEIGESGNEDAIKMFLQEGSELTLLGEGNMGGVAEGPVEGMIRVLRNGEGFWQISSAFSSEVFFTPELELFNTDFLPQSASLFGIECAYTSSRRDLFYFDDIYIDRMIPDTIGPVLGQIIVLDNLTLELVFDEPLEPGTVSNVENYLVNNGVGTPVSAIPDAEQPNRVQLQFDNSFQSGIIYTLEINRIADEAGNLSGLQTLDFRIIESPASEDLIINEILFNPKSGGSDFIELFNKSDKFLSLQGLVVSNSQNEQQATIDSMKILEPGKYLAISDHIGDLQDKYLTMGSETLLENDIPSFNNDEGNVRIQILEEGNIITIDSFDYDEDYHFELLDNPDGVSLERINEYTETQDPQNWTSAASVAGFATPGYRNSQNFETNPSLISKFFRIPKKTFSPNNDGQDDLFFIEYMVNNTGFLANIKIFDASGRHIKDLIRNELLAASGFIKWDGSSAEGTPAKIGIYLIWIQLFNPDGTVEQEIFDCVLADTLN